MRVSRWGPFGSLFLPIGFSPDVHHPYHPLTGLVGLDTGYRPLPWPPPPTRRPTCTHVVLIRSPTCSRCVPFGALCVVFLSLWGTPWAPLNTPPEHPSLHTHVYTDWRTGACPIPSRFWPVLATSRWGIHTRMRVPLRGPFGALCVFYFCPLGTSGYTPPAPSDPLLRILPYTLEWRTGPCPLPAGIGQKPSHPNMSYHTHIRVPHYVPYFYTSGFHPLCTTPTTP